MNATLQYTDDLELDLQSYGFDCERVDGAIQSLESVVMAQDLVLQSDKALDQTTFDLLQHSVECFLKMGQIGHAHKSFVISNEAFGEEQITQAALESFGQGVKNVFMSIINAIKSAFSWMWGLIKKLFGRGKDHEEKIDALKAQSDEVKAMVAELSEEQKKASPYERGPHGWFTKVKIDRPEVLRRLVTSKGLMTKHDLDKYQTELTRVFQLQSKNMIAGMHVKNGVQDVSLHYEPPLPASHDMSLSKLVTTDPSDKVYLSAEFGDGEHIFVLVPADDKALEGQVRTARWLEKLRIGEIKAPKIPKFEKYHELEGDMVDVDFVLDSIQVFNKILVHHADMLKNYMTAKEHFIRDMEKMIKEEGVTLFSAREKKDKRDALMGQLKYFRKVMDQPAVTYYGKCEGILTSFEHLAMYVLAFNRRNGNLAELRQSS